MLLVAIIIYHIKTIIKNDVLPETLTADFTMCPFLLPALQNRFLTQPVSNQNEPGKLPDYLDSQFIKIEASVPLKLRRVPETQANDIS